VLENEVLTTGAHVIQLALTPIFLLSAVGSLLNVFSTRLGRISDRIHVIEKEGSGADGSIDAIEVAGLHRRAWLLNVAVILATLAGAMTCVAAIVLFVGVLRDAGTVNLLFGLFGGALIAAVCAMSAFACEVTVGGNVLRRKLHVSRHR
jgi:Protein of unknown function (DUF2721)